MERTEPSASSSSSSSSESRRAELERERRELNDRQKKLEADAAELEKAERGPVDREESLIDALVQLVQGGSQHRPVNELRARAGKVVDVLKG